MYDLMEETDLISVLIPVYKVERYIDRCINSIVNQTYKNIEVLVVIQPSSDDSEQKVYGWRDKDVRIKIIRQELPDLATARNNLIRNASGKYVVFVDSDDFVSRDHIRFLHNLARKYDADIVQCGCYSFEDDRFIPEIDLVNCLTDILTGREYTYGILSGKYGSDGGVVQTKLYKKHLFNNIEFPEMRLCEDVATVYRVTWKANRVILYSGQSYYYQSKRGDSLTHHDSMKSRVMTDGFLAYLEQLDFFEDKDGKLYNEAVYRICNKIVKIKNQTKQNAISIDAPRIIAAINNHKEYVNKCIKSSISKRKKCICLFGYYSPRLAYAIWEKRGAYRHKKEWRQKR